MKTLALRFGETFSPPCGTIKAHQEVINKLGYVWYGKAGAKIADARTSVIKREADRILLIRSGKTERYWGYFEEISKEMPSEGIPDYYKDMADRFHTWFKFIKIEPAPKDVISCCTVISSNQPLGTSSKYSANPCFYIEYNEKGDE